MSPAARPLPRAHRQARALLGVIVLVLVVAAVAAIAGVGGSSKGAPPLVTSPQTISPDLGAGAQCPAGAANGHCIVPAKP